MDATPKILISAQDGFMLTAHFAPARGERRGGVIVIQEIFGVTDHIKAMCARFAAAGYDALAPGLFERIDRTFHAEHDEMGIAKGRAAVADTPWDQVRDDVQAAIDQLKEAGPVFAVGFCWGGAAAWLAACRCTGLSGAAGFYGRLINQLISEKPRVPTILHYGRTDPAIPMIMVDEVRSRHRDVGVHLYDAGHGFCREGSSDFDRQSSELAIERTCAHFAACGG